MSKDITLGIFGSGQLGTELVKSAKKLGLKTIVFSNDKHGPAQKFSDSYIFSDYDDVSNLKKFINSIDVCTYEFENIPLETINKVNERKKVQTSQNVFRAKGILWFMESERKHIFHLSGKRFSLDDEEWTKEKSNKIVLIGKNLDHQTIKNQLSSCRFSTD